MGFFKLKILTLKEDIIAERSCEFLNALYEKLHIPERIISWQSAICELYAVLPCGSDYTYGRDQKNSWSVLTDCP